MFLSPLFFGGLPPINKTFGASLNNTSTLVGLRSASLTLNADGTAAQSGGGPPPNWLVSPAAGAGASYWLRLTANAPTNTTITGMTPGTWYSLASAQQVIVQNSNSSLEGTGTFTLDFAYDAAGSSIAATLVGSVSWDVGKVS